MPALINFDFHLADIVFPISPVAEHRSGAKPITEKKPLVRIQRQGPLEALKRALKISHRDEGAAAASPCLGEIRRNLDCPVKRRNGFGV